MRIRNAAWFASHVLRPTIAPWALLSQACKPYSIAIRLEASVDLKKLRSIAEVP